MTLAQAQALVSSTGKTLTNAKTTARQATTKADAAVKAASQASAAAVKADAAAAKANQVVLTAKPNQLAAAQKAADKANQAAQAAQLKSTTAQASSTQAQSAQANANSQLSAAQQAYNNAQTQLSAVAGTSTTASSGRKGNIKVAYTPFAVTPGIFMMDVNSALVEYAQSASVSASQNQPNVAELHDGEILVVASDTTTVVAGDYSLSVSPGTIALVSREGGCLKVRNLFEQGAGSGSVRVLLGNQYLSASAGQEIIVGLDIFTLAKAMKDDAVGRRMQKTFDVGGLKVSKCEVSLVSLVPNTDVLSFIMHSNMISDKAIAAKIVRTAACLSTVTSGHGAFTHVQP